MFEWWQVWSSKNKTAIRQMCRGDLVPIRVVNSINIPADSTILAQLKKGGYWDCRTKLAIHMQEDPPRAVVLEFIFVAQCAL